MTSIRRCDCKPLLHRLTAMAPVWPLDIARARADVNRRRHSCHGRSGRAKGTLFLMNSNIQELQLDGLPGPTHHFGGLSFGNLGGRTQAAGPSRHRRAARQGLAKRRRVVALGTPQALPPPLPRPDLHFLRQVGFSGPDTDVLRNAAAHEPYVLHLAMSSAFM